MDDFIFGPTGFSEQRVALIRQRLGGVVHGYRTDPLAPQPGQPVTLWLWVGDEQRADRACCYYTSDGSDPQGRRGRAENGTAIPLEAASVEWLDLRWAYGRWWRGEFPPQPAGTIVRYRLEAFSALGGEGVWADGGARFAYLVDDAEPPAWVREAIIYQVFVDRFYPGDNRPWRPPAHPNDFYGGTLQGVIDKLDYIAEAGFNTIWLSPFFVSPSYHGYDTVDYYLVDPRYGDNATFQRLMQEAHQRGLRVLLDFVANHCSREHPFFRTAQQDRRSPYYPWFTFQHWPDDYVCFFTSKGLPQWNLDYPAARRYIIEAACHWLREYGVDGYRLDYTLGPSHDFWTDFRQATRQAAPESFTIAEAVESPEVMRTYSGRLDGCLDFPFCQIARHVFAYGTMDLARFDAFLTNRAAYFPENFTLGAFLDNHDMNRFLWIAQDKRRLKLAALCQFTLSSPPIVYYGTEVGLSQEADVRTPQGNAFHHRARLPMPWGDTQDGDLRRYYRRLAALRREHPAIGTGERLVLHLDEKVGTYAYCVGARESGNQEIGKSTNQQIANQQSAISNLQSPILLVALNNSDAPAAITLPVASLALADGTVLVDVLDGGQAPRYIAKGCNVSGQAVVSGGQVTVALAARSGAALVRAGG